MGNSELSGLTPMMNEEGSFFGINIRWVIPQASRLIFSIDRSYCDRFKQNCSGWVDDLITHLSRRETLILIWNIKRYIPSLLSSKAPYALDWAYLTTAETNAIGCRLSTYKIIYSIILDFNRYYWNDALIEMQSLFVMRVITSATPFYPNA